MFMTEVLGRCSLLEQRVADIYRQFAGSLNDDKALESYWLGMAEEEKHHGKILAAEKAALEVDSNTGYFMPEFSAKLMEMDVQLKRVEEKARIGVTKDEAFALALELEQSELNTIYRDLVLMGRAAVKLMARHLDESLSLPKHQQGLVEAQDIATIQWEERLSLPKHQQGLVEGVKRFQPSAAVRQQAEAWAAAHHMGQRRL